MEHYKDGDAVLVICQKSKITDWMNHWKDNYQLDVYDGTSKKSDWVQRPGVTVVNYDLVFRRKQLMLWTNFHLILDESSLIQNDRAKRTKAILSLKPKTVTLLSGTPTAGRYENLWSQMQLLDWRITKSMYWANFVKYHIEYFNGSYIPVKVIDGYKNVDYLKEKLKEHGAVFMRAEEAIDLPEQVYNTIKVPMTKDYKKFKKDRVLIVGEDELVGDNALTYLLRLRQLASIYADAKYDALSDILETCPDKIVVFYNFTKEGERIADVCHNLGRDCFFINGQLKEEQGFHASDNGVLIVQYQAGSMGGNYQDANLVVYMSPTLSADQYMQSEARIHRIGQKRTCFYTYILMEGSVEEHILEVIKRREDYTLELFRKYDRI